jgi:hypothetical protein
MRFWKVRVDCWSAPLRKGKAHKVVVRWFIVYKEQDDTERFMNTAKRAMKIAEQHAEKTAEFGPLWIKFHAREASMVTLPFEIKP